MKANKAEVLELYFIENRHRLLDVAAFLDRVERHEGEPDFRYEAFLKALESLRSPAEGLTRVQAVHHSFSDQSEEAQEKAGGQVAYGAVKKEVL